jgi:glycolate oxidase FAD binding subunit
MTAVAGAVEALQEAVRRGPRVLPVAGATKPALSSAPSEDVVALDVSALRGIEDYDPGELTFTALAATPVADVAGALAEHGQYLPFDPPLPAAGATLGGVVASATSGPNAFRHGGVRDFVIGVQLIDGTGRLVSGGGRVVKNAAGFDLPKLMVGSMGRLGVMVRLSFKVFPHPRATTTLVFPAGDPGAALPAVAAIARGPLEAEAIDVDHEGRLLVRLGGDPDTLGPRAERCAAITGLPATRLDGDEDEALWREASELAWAPAGSRIARVGLTARHVEALVAALSGSGALIRMSLAANLAWVAWPADREVEELHRALAGLSLGAMVLTAGPERTLLGTVGGGAFADRVRRALDPDRRFLEN